MNRRERAVSPTDSSPSPYRRNPRLLPRIQYSNRTNPPSEDVGGASSAPSTDRAWEFDDRSKEQSRRQRQQRQRAQHGREQRSRLLERLHSEPEEETASLIEKFELLPDNGNSRDGEENGDADSIFSEEPPEGQNADLDGQPQQAEFVDDDKLNVRRKLQEAALAEAMSAPGRSRRQRLATEMARSGRPPREGSAHHPSGSSSLPAPASKSPGRDSLDAFLASNIKSDKSGISSVTITVHTAELESILTTNRKDEAELGSILTKTVVTTELGSLLTKENIAPQKTIVMADEQHQASNLRDETVQDSRSASNNDGTSTSSRSDGTPSLKENRSDLYQSDLVDFDCSSVDEHRQSPEHSSGSSKGSPEQQGHSEIGPAAETPPRAPSMCCSIPTLGEYSPIGTVGTKLLPTSQPSNSSSNPSSNSCHNTEENLSSDDDLSIKGSSDSNSLVLNGSSDLNSLVGNEEGKDMLGTVEYTIQQRGSKDAVECSIAMGPKETIDSAVSMASAPGKPANPEEFLRQHSDGASTPRAAILEQRGWSHHHRYARLRLPNPEQAQPVVVPLNHLSSALVLQSGAPGSDILDSSARSSRGIVGQVTHTQMVGSSSAKDLTELQAWTAELSELRAWKANAGKSLVEKEGELEALRSWKDDAEKEQEEHAMAIAELELLKGQVSTLLDEREGRETKVHELEHRVESAKSEAEEWKAAAEESVKKSSQDMTKLTEAKAEMKREKIKLEKVIEAYRKKQYENDSSGDLREAHDEISTLSEINAELKAEIERLCGDVDLCRNEIESMLASAKLAQEATANLQAHSHYLEKELKESEEEVGVFTAKAGEMSTEIDNLRAMLEVANTKKDAMAGELVELKAWKEAQEEVHELHVNKREQAEDDRSSEIEALQEQLEESRVLIEEANGHVEASVRDADQLKSLVQKLSEDSRELQTKLDESKSNKEEPTQLKNQVEELSVEASTLRAGLERANLAKTSMETKFSALEASKALEIQALQEEMQTKEVKVTSLSLQGKELSLRLLELCDWKSSAEESMDVTAVELAEKDSVISKLNDEVTSLKSQVKEASAECKKIQEMLDIAIDEKEEAEAALDEALNKAELDSSDIGDIDEGDNVISELQRQLEVKTVLIDDLQKQLSTNEEKSSGDKRDLEAAINAKQEDNEKSADTLSFQESIHDLKSHIEACEAEISHLQNQLETSRVEYEASSKTLTEERDSGLEKYRQLSTDLADREDEVRELTNDLREAVSKAKKMETENDSMKLVIEARQVDGEKASAKIAELRKQIKAATDSIAEKSEEVSTLKDTVAHLESELQDTRDFYDKKLIEECGQMQTELDSMHLIIETKHAESEKASAEATDLRDQIQAANETVAEKSEEVASLTATLARLQTQLEETKETQNKKLVAERGHRLDEQDTLAQREKELRKLQDDLQEAAAKSRKLQSTIDSMTLVAESTSSEVTDLRAWKREAERRMEEQIDLMKAMDSLAHQVEERQQKLIEKETEIISLRGECEEQKRVISEIKLQVQELEDKLVAKENEHVQKLKEAEDEASSRFDKEQTKLQNERDLLRGVRQKERDVMSDLISTNERIVEEIDQLKMFKEEAEFKCEQEKTASGVLAQHIVDLELELEQQRKKYHEATMALAEMENALMTVEKQRKKLARKKSPTDEAPPVESRKTECIDEVLAADQEESGCSEDECSLDGIMGARSSIEL